MAKRSEIYTCPDCDQLLEVLKDCDCGSQFKCGDHVMELLEAGTTDAAVEKHVPVIERTAAGFKVKVGSVAHPMQDDHWIEFIEIMADNRVYRAYLSPGDAPEAEFSIDAQNITAREHCNLHGLWEAKS